MSKEEFEKLTDAYLTGKASSKEEELVDAFFEAQEKKHSIVPSKTSEEMWTAVEQRVNQNWHINADKIEAKKQSNPWLISLAVAASVSVLIMLFYFQQKPEVITVKNLTAHAHNGQKSIITLGDGTRVYLNSGSTLTYPEVFEASIRNVVLTGEAFFEVMRDEKRPFIVRTGSIDTKVLGTSFNVSAYADEPVSIAVATGKVQVKETNQKDSVLLTPNYQATFNNEKLNWETNTVDINKVVAWKNQTLNFDGVSLAEVAKELERWYNVSITFENDNIKKCIIHGQYKDQSLQSVLKSIQYMYQIDFKFKSQSKVELYGKGCSK